MSFTTAGMGHTEKMPLQCWGRWGLLHMWDWWIWSLLQASWAILNFGLHLKGTALCTFLLNQFIHSYFLPFYIQMLLPFETCPVVLPPTKREDKIYDVHKHTLCEALPDKKQSLLGSIKTNDHPRQLKKKSDTSNQICRRKMYCSVWVCVCHHIKA